MDDNAQRLVLALSIISRDNALLDSILASRSTATSSASSSALPAASLSTLVTALSASPSAPQPTPPSAIPTAVTNASVSQSAPPVDIGDHDKQPCRSHIHDQPEQRKQSALNDVLSQPASLAQWVEQFSSSPKLREPASTDLPPLFLSPIAGPSKPAPLNESQPRRSPISIPRLSPSSLISTAERPWGDMDFSNVSLAVESSTFLQCLRIVVRRHGIQEPVVDGRRVHLFDLFEFVHYRGGSQKLAGKSDLWALAEEQLGFKPRDTQGTIQDAEAPGDKAQKVFNEYLSAFEDRFHTFLWKRRRGLPGNRLFELLLSPSDDLNDFEDATSIVDPSIMDTISDFAETLVHDFEGFLSSLPPTVRSGSGVHLAELINAGCNLLVEKLSAEKRLLYQGVSQRKLWTTVSRELLQQHWIKQLTSANVRLGSLRSVIAKAYQQQSPSSSAISELGAQNASGSTSRLDVSDKRPGKILEPAPTKPQKRPRLFDSPSPPSGANNVPDASLPAPTSQLPIVGADLGNSSVPLLLPLNDAAGNPILDDNFLPTASADSPSKDWNTLFRAIEAFSALPLPLDIDRGEHGIPQVPPLPVPITNGRSPSAPLQQIPSPSALIPSPSAVVTSPSAQVPRGPSTTDQEDSETRLSSGPSQVSFDRSPVNSSRGLPLPAINKPMPKEWGSLVRAMDTFQTLYPSQADVVKNGGLTPTSTITSITSPSTRSIVRPRSAQDQYSMSGREVYGTPDL